MQMFHHKIILVSLLAYILFGYTLCVYFHGNSITVSVSSWKKNWPCDWCRKLYQLLADTNFSFIPDIRMRFLSLVINLIVLRTLPLPSLTVPLPSTPYFYKSASIWQAPYMSKIATWRVKRFGHVYKFYQFLSHMYLLYNQNLFCSKQYQINLCIQQVHCTCRFTA